MDNKNYPDLDMQIAKHLMLVRINKELQEHKRSRIGSILLHQDYIHMTRNLQFGIVVQIGSIAARNYPMAKVGYEVMFHHAVEDKEDRLLDTDPETGDKYLYLYANDENENYEIYGFVTQTGELIPSPHYVWMSPHVTRIKRKLSSQYLHLETAMGDDWDSPERLQEQIDSLKEQRDLLEPAIWATRYTTEREEERRKIEVVTAMNRLQDEGAMLTRLMHKKRLGIGQVIAINSEMQRTYPQLQPGSMLVCHLPLYPLDIYNVEDPGNSARFLLVRSSEVVAYTEP